MNRVAKIQVTNTGEALVSRVEDETSASEMMISAKGITGWVQKKNRLHSEPVHDSSK